MNDPQFAKVLCTWIEILGSSGTNPGEVRLVHYVIDGGALTLTDAQGQRRKDDGGRPLVVRMERGEDHATIAKRLARRTLRTQSARRESPLLYERATIV